MMDESVVTQKRRRVLEDGTLVTLVYEKESDELDIYFGENRKATGIQLSDHILLRLDRAAGKAVSLSLIDFSLLVRQTSYGPPSFRLDGLEDLPQDLREMTLQVIKSTPVCHFLKLGAFYAAPQQSPIPISYIEHGMILPIAA